jgi:leucyl/phenylalanyl-tRNA--protein transferase
LDFYVLGTAHQFPPIESASKEGIVAIGGDLHPDRLLLAYKSGVFPWYNEGEPIIWFSPDPRMVLFPSQIKISKSMLKLIKNQHFKITFNQEFKKVIRYCKTVQRPGQQGTWITDDLEQSMIALHQRGIAKSIEVWKDQQLVGGLYGLDIGNIFCGESMFSLMSNASKCAFIYLAQKLEKENYSLLDCQVYNEHLESLGAVEISREQFKEYLYKE